MASSLAPALPKINDNDNDTINVLVTGGAGFVGTETLLALQRTSPTWTLYSLDLNPPATPIRGVTYLTGSITSPSETTQALTQCHPLTAIIHTAGIVPPLGQRYGRALQPAVYATNIEGTRNVLAAAQATGTVRAFVFTSSCCAVVDDMAHAYPNIDESWETSASGSTIYGESKARVEPLVLAADNPDTGFRTCALRPSVLFGPEDYQLIPSIQACIAKFETPFVIGDGLNFWDVTDVRNVAHAHVLAVRNLLQLPGGEGKGNGNDGGGATAGGQAIFIANDEPIPFRDFCLEIWKNFGHYPPFEITIPESVARAVAAVADFLGDWLGLPVTLSRGSVGDACAIRYCDGEKARRLLGYEPIIGIEQGIRESCERLKERMAGGDIALRKEGNGRAGG